MTKRDTYLRSKYHITEEEYQKLLEFNNGGCWICGRKPKTGSLNVDHDHKIEKEHGLRKSIRGLLCGFPCNKKMIGRHRRQHAELYRRAAKYLTEWADSTQAYLRGRAYVEGPTKDKVSRQTRKARRSKSSSVK